MENRKITHRNERKRRGIISRKVKRSSQTYLKAIIFLTIPDHRSLSDPYIIFTQEMHYYMIITKAFTIYMVRKLHQITPAEKQLTTVHANDQHIFLDGGN